MEDYPFTIVVKRYVLLFKKKGEAVPQIGQKQAEYLLNTSLRLPNKTLRRAYPN